MADVKSEKLAAQFGVDDLPSALRVGTRLHNILRKLESGETLNSTSLTFLQAQGLTALAALANGAIDHVNFKAQSAREQEARVKRAVHLTEIAAENAGHEADALKARPC